MDTKETVSARLLRLAYAQPDPKKQRRQQEPLPGWLFDATVVGLFVVLGVAYAI